MNKARDKKKEIKSFLIMCAILFIPVFQYASCYTWFFHTLEEKNFVNIINNVNSVLSQNPFTLEYIKAMPIESIGKVIIVFAILCFMAYVQKFEINWSSMQGIENGSAKFNDNLKEYTKLYIDTKHPDHNMVLGENVFLNMDGAKTRKNNNILVLGGSGAGKSRFFVKPNILQNAGYCSFVVTDPSGELLQSTGHLLEEKGYKVKVFNLSDMQHSCCFNPFCYIKDETTVRVMIDCFMKNTAGKGGGEQFWEDTTKSLLMACALYLIEVAPKEEQNFNYIAKLIENAKIEDEDDPEAKSTLDFMMDELAAINPESSALRYYNIFKQGAGKTAKSILISTAVRLADFNNSAIKELTSTDNLELEKMGDELTALFVIIPTASTTFNYIVAMMYTQLFSTLYDVAEATTAKHLTVPVRFLLDEFANIGQIPDFDKLLATMRKYWISCAIILQNLAQLKALYKESNETVMGNCDTTIFLGGNELSTCKLISEKLGKTTIRVKNTSGGKKGGGGYSRNASARALLTPDEVAKMPDDTCIIMIKGLDPFLIKKYSYTDHPNYKYTGDADGKYFYVPSEHFNTSDSSGFLKTNIIQDKIEYIKSAVSDVADEIILKDEAFVTPEIYDFDENLLKEVNCESVEEFKNNIEFDEAFDPDYEFSMPTETVEKLEDIKDEDNLDDFINADYKPDEDDTSEGVYEDYVDSDIFSIL